MVSAVKTEPVRISDWLLYEEDEIGRYSRDNVTVGPSQTLLSGAVVGVNAAGTQVIEYDNVDPDGGIAIGILLDPVTTGPTETKKAVIVARHARVATERLIWKAGLNAADKLAGLADLSLKGIVTVNEI
jgi:hypothetical protein